MARARVLFMRTPLQARVCSVADACSRVALYEQLLSVQNRECLDVRNGVVHETSITSESILSEVTNCCSLDDTKIAQSAA